MIQLSAKCLTFSPVLIPCKAASSAKRWRGAIPLQAGGMGGTPTVHGRGLELEDERCSRMASNATEEQVNKAQRLKRWSYWSTISFIPAA